MTNATNDSRWNQRLFTILWVWISFRTILPWLVFYRLTFEGNTYSWGSAYFGRMFHSSGLARPDFLVIYALLAVPLRSYIQPLIIMAVIPFGLVGAIFGHWFMYFTREIFTDQTFNFSMMSIFGFVALTGVVVNSSLVLVHYINERRSMGIGLDEAVRDAGVARFRPIVLTSITTFVGLAPILRETSVSAQFLIPMATSLGFGVLFGSAISLFLVPSAYYVLEDLKVLLARKRTNGTPNDPLVTVEASTSNGADI